MDYSRFVLWWIVLLLLLWFGLSLGGCTTVEWGDVKYSRLGGQELESMSITKLENGDVLVELNKYKGEGIAPIVEGAVRGAMMGLKP